MNKQQLMLASGGVVLLALLMIFGKTAEKKEMPSQQAAAAAAIFDVAKVETEIRQKLTPSQSTYLAKLDNSVSRGNVKEQQANAYEQMAGFWKDSLHNHELYVFYLSKAAKLVNLEKNLTFAARQTLDELRNEGNTAIRSWKAEQAIDLYQQAISLNPNRDSLKVELASCYVFGKGMAGDPQETMKGIQQLLSIVKQDSTNMQAQLVLGIGGVVSNQLDKAVTRLETVLQHEPGNLEAMSWLADAYANKGDKQNAVKWYEAIKRMVNKPEFSKEVDERIKSLK